MVDNRWSFFCLQNGNDYSGQYSDIQYVMKTVILVKLKVTDPKIVFDPSFHECRDTIIRCFQEIIAGGEGLPRVSVCIQGKGHPMINVSEVNSSLGGEGLPRVTKDIIASQRYATPRDNV